MLDLIEHIDVHRRFIGLELDPELVPSAPLSNAVEPATISSGERDCVLLQGASGSGKSTLGGTCQWIPRAPRRAAVSARHRSQNARRRHVASAPQFHENQMFAASLAFNLLMGRDWPPDPQTAQDAMDCVLRRAPSLICIAHV